MSPFPPIIAALLVGVAVFCLMYFVMSLNDQPSVTISCTDGSPPSIQWNVDKGTPRERTIVTCP